ncbi:MAG: hypothetical protein Q9172_003464 [Xanthocarpia lactea]
MAAPPVYVANKPYEANPDSNGGSSNIECANHTAIATHSGKGNDSGLSRQCQSARLPLNILEEYIDESYFEPNLCDDGLGSDGPDVTTSIYPTTDLSEVGSLYDPDQSSDASFRVTVRAPPVVYRVRSDVDQDCGIYGHGPFTVAHYKQPPEYSLTDEAFQAISTLSPALAVTANPDPGALGPRREKGRATNSPFHNRLESPGHIRMVPLLSILHLACAHRPCNKD